MLRQCENCGNRFEAKDYLVKRGQGRFCSVKCAGAWRSKHGLASGENNPSWKGGKHKFTCDYCGNVFEAYPSDRRKGKHKFCSRDCHNQWMSENQSGENHHQWNRIKKVCKHCEKEFYVHPSTLAREGRGQFCSKECSAAYLSSKFSGDGGPNWKGGKETVSCEWCNKKFDIWPFKLQDKRRGRFCSIQCRVEWLSENFSGENSPHWKEKEQVQCERCGKLFEITSTRIEGGRGKFCSNSCKYFWMRERFALEGNPAWLGGISFEPYPSTFNEAFKRKIRERDGYQCQVCGCKDAYDVHHINYEKQDTIPGNCITLCRSCHCKTNHDREYWQSFLSSLMAMRMLYVS